MGCTADDTLVDVQATLREIDGGAAFHGPLKFGDAEQIRVLAAINGDRPFCDKCFEV